MHSSSRQREQPLRLSSAPSSLLPASCKCPPCAAALCSRRCYPAQILESIFQRDAQCLHPLIPASPCSHCCCPMRGRGWRESS